MTGIYLRAGSQRVKRPNSGPSKKKPAVNARYNVKSYDEDIVLNGDHENNTGAEDNIEGFTKDEVNLDEVINKNNITQEQHAYGAAFHISS